MIVFSHTINIIAIEYPVLKSKCYIMKQLIYLKSRKECTSQMEHALNQIEAINKVKPITSFLYIIDYDHKEIDYDSLRLMIENKCLDYQVISFEKSYASIVWMVSIILFGIHLIGSTFIHSYWYIFNLLLITLSLLTNIVNWINIIHRLIHLKSTYKDCLNFLQLFILLSALLASSSNALFQFSALYFALCIIESSDYLIEQTIHYQTLKPYINYIRGINELLNIKTGDTFLPIHPLSIQVNDTVAYRKGNTIVNDGIVINGNATLTGLLNQQNTMHVHKDDPIASGYKVSDGYIEVKVTRILNESEITHLYQSYKSSLCTPNLRLINKKINQPFSIFITLVIACFCALIVQLIPFITLTPLLILQITCLYLYLNHLLLNINLTANHVYISFINHTLIKNPTVIHNTAHYDQAWISYHPYIWDKYKVTDVLVSNTLDQTTFNHILYSVHKRKKDALSNAILDYLKSQNIKDTNLTLTKSIFAKGIDTFLNGAKVTPYTIDQCQSLGIDLSDFEKLIDAYQKEGKLITLYIQEGNIIGFIALADCFKQDALTCIDALSKEGIDTVLLDGLSEMHRHCITQQLNGSNSYDINDSNAYFAALNNQQFLLHHHVVALTNATMPQSFNRNVSLSVSYCLTQSNDIVILDHQLPTLAAWLNFNNAWHQLTDKYNQIMRLLPVSLSVSALLFAILFHNDLTLGFYGILFIILLLIGLALRAYCLYRFMHLHYVATVTPNYKIIQFEIEDCICDYDITQVKKALSIYSDCRFNFDLQHRLATIKVNSQTSTQAIEATIIKAGYKIKR